LGCKIKVRAESRVLSEQVNFIFQDAQQDFPLVRELEYEVRTTGGYYDIFENGKLNFTSSDITSFTQRLLLRIHEKAFEDFADCVRIHAGCGEYRGNRFLVVGDSGAGKTTLMVRLLFEGFKVDGDELVLAKDGDSFPFPRRFHIKEHSLPLLPELRNYIRNNYPKIDPANGSKIYAFSPSDAGFSWEIRKGRIAALFYLEPNRRRETEINSCPKHLMVHKTMPRTFFSASHEHRKIGELCRLVDHTACYSLQLGSLSSAVDQIRRTLDRVFA